MIICFSNNNRNSRNIVFHEESSGSMLSDGGGGSLELSEIRLGEATLVPVQSNRGELSHGLECRTVDGEILQLQLTRSVSRIVLFCSTSTANVLVLAVMLEHN